MSGSCKYEGCTVDETGVCALERVPETCENRSGAGGSVLNVQASTEGVSTAGAPGDPVGAPVLSRPLARSAFPSSRPLGLEDLNQLMSSRYVNLVGILGDPESGKTACLASLYLLVANAMLAGWSFADSRTLTAFEDIARGARDWNDGIPPDQMTVHTELSDDRQPGFLHLRLVRESDGRPVDLALPDVPGEWTQALINSAESERFGFLKSAEVIWIVLDGRVLANRERRQGLIARVGQLVARLNTMLEQDLPKLLLVVTHRDRYVIDDAMTARLMGEVERRGATAEIVSIAPFSDAPEVTQPGFGIAGLIDSSLSRATQRADFWKSKPADAGRFYLNFRRAK